MTLIAVLAVVFTVLCEMECLEVVIVGGGLAGLSAAITCADNGLHVTLIDGEKNLGGNSAKASSGINGCGTVAQKKMNITDSLEACFADTMSAGDYLNDPLLVDILVGKSADAVAWLLAAGVDLMDVNLCGGHTQPRTHWIPSPKEGRPIPVGFEIIKRLKGKLEELQNSPDHKVTIKTLTEVSGLVTKGSGADMKVTGVKTIAKESDERAEIRADVVILTTGGFSNDHSDKSLLKEFAPDKMSFPTTNGPFARGEGVKMARAVGAALVAMDKVQIHPTGFIDPKDPAGGTKFLAAEALRGKGAILVNDKGARFANELGRRDYLSDLIISQCAKDPDAQAHVAFMIMNEEAVASFGPPAFNFYSKIKGFFEEFPDLASVAEHFKMDLKKLVESLNLYNEASDGGRADAFGKTRFPVLFRPKEKLFVARVTPSIHYTMGGVKINEHAQAISSDGKLIQGLLAAGEVSGGVHGSNRLAGNSLLECVVFGRIAGNSAAGKFEQPPKEEL